MGTNSRDDISQLPQNQKTTSEEQNPKIFLLDDQTSLLQNIFDHIHIDEWNYLYDVLR